MPDPMAAMLQSWDFLQAYAFTPFAMIPQVLRLLSGTVLTLIAPFWPQWE